MADEITIYMEDNGLDADVFFTNEDGPITPSMRADWVADHELTVKHPDIDYDNETGFYNFVFRVPEESARNYVADKEKARRIYAKYPQLNVLFTSSGVYLSGSVQTPGTAILFSTLASTTPSDLTGLSK